VFCDLRGFTAFTETSEPEEVMAVLHDYHEGLGELIFRHEGTLDRFAGDGIMIVFNDPIICADHTERAVKLALEMRDRVEKLAQQWQRRGHTLGFGVGIAAGYATLGQIGFERRREYTAIGSVINLASRLCDEAKPGQIIIGQRAFGAVEHNVESKPVGELSLKGFAKPVAAHEILRWREAAQGQQPPAPAAATARGRKRP
jgi:adenylate cyclase